MIHRRQRAMSRGGGGRPDRPGSQSDRTLRAHRPRRGAGAAADHVRLDRRRRVPLLAAIFSVGSGLSLLGLVAAAHQPSRPPRPPWRRCSASASPSTTGSSWSPGTASSSTTGSTSSTSIGRTGGDLRCGHRGRRRHRRHRDPRPLRLRRPVRRRARPGLGRRRRGHDAAALTLVPALLGLAGRRVLRRAEGAASAADEDRRPGGPPCGRARRPGRPRTSAAPSPAGAGGQRPAVAVGDRRRPCCWSCSRSRCSRIRLGQLDAGTDPTSQTAPAGLRPDRRGFGPGANGPLTVVVEPCRTVDGSDATRRCSRRCRQTLQKTDGVAVGRRAAGQQGRDTARDQRDPDDRAAGRGDQGPGRRPCAATCCADQDDDDVRRRHRRPATSTSPRRSPSGCPG